MDPNNNNPQDPNNPAAPVTVSPAEPPVPPTFSPPPPPAPVPEPVLPTQSEATLPSEPIPTWQQTPPVSSAPIPPEAGSPPTWPPETPPQPQAEPSIPSFGQPNPVSAPPPIFPGLSSEPNSPVPTPPEAGPTDLSHLAGNNTAGNTIVQPETLVMPSPNETEANQVVTGSGTGGFPKWLLVVGGLILLIAVGGASAYFILGIGQQTNTATETSIQQPAVVVSPTQVPLPSIPAATSSAGFGDLSGSQPSSTESGTSALELLRQRQAQ